MVDPAPIVARLPTILGSAERVSGRSDQITSPSGDETVGHCRRYFSLESFQFANISLIIDGTYFWTIAIRLSGSRENCGHYPRKQSSAARAAISTRHSTRARSAAR